MVRGEVVILSAAKNLAWKSGANEVLPSKISREVSQSPNEVAVAPAEAKGSIRQTLRLLSQVVS
jgi:hypothetical protein